MAALREKSGVAGAGWVDGGVYLLARAWIEALPAGIPLSLERDVLPYWIERGVGGYGVHAQSLDIGTPEGLTRAPSFLPRQTFPENRARWMGWPLHK